MVRSTRSPVSDGHGDTHGLEKSFCLNCGVSLAEQERNKKAVRHEVTWSVVAGPHSSTSC